MYALFEAKKEDRRMLERIVAEPNITEVSSDFVDAAPLVDSLLDSNDMGSAAVSDADSDLEETDANLGRPTVDGSTNKKVLFAQSAEIRRKIEEQAEA